MPSLGKKKSELPSKENVNAPTESFFDRTAEDAVAHFQSDALRGLTEAEAESRVEKYGTNEITGGEQVKWWKVLLSNIFNPMNGVLLIAIILSSVATNVTEVVVIALVILTNTAIGFRQEYKSEQTMDALRKLSSPTARVMRNGEVKTIQSSHVVPGDILYLEEGDQVAADARMIEAVNLNIDEALLTGESMPVKKGVDIIEGNPLVVTVGDRTNMAFKNTTVSKGRGHAVVTATGLATEIGAIAKSVLEGSVAQKTPLEKAMTRLMFALLGCALLIILGIFALAGFTNPNNSVASYAIAVAVAILPEGLPAVVTVTMSFGVQRMAKQQAVVRRLVSLENLGSVTNICSDKTGTLTQGKMMATRGWIAGQYLHIEGSADPNDTSTAVFIQENENAEKQRITNCEDNELLNKAITVCALCHSSNLAQNEEGKWVVTGDTTELPLIVLALRFAKTKESLENNYHFVAEAPFDSSIKRMTVVRRDKQGDLYFFAKGAVEGILSRATGYYDASGSIVDGITEEYREEVNRKMASMAGEGLRVLALGMRVIAGRDVPEGMVDKFASGEGREEMEQGFIFIGLLGLRDPPRAESGPAVENAHKAGIVVHMATGDHPLTARTIAKEVKILKEPINDKLVMVAAEFDQMTDEEVDAMQLPLVLARCSPQSKVKLIRALHRRQKKAAMTGDGVNDAPAVKNADVGIAMGQGGSDVTRQASDITLTDDNFATIILAVGEGRRIFSNITKFALHLLSGNVSEVIALVLGLIWRNNLGQFIFPMSAIQILYLNLVTSSPIALALGVELGGKEMMRQAPRQHGVFHKELIMDTLTYGTILGGLALATYVISVLRHGADFSTYPDCSNHSDLAKGDFDIWINQCEIILIARGVCFHTLSLCLLAHGFICRHPRRSLFKNSLRGTKFLVGAILLGLVLIVPTSYIPSVNTWVFDQYNIDGIGWALIFGGMGIFLVCSEIYKFIKRMVMPSLYAVPDIDALIADDKKKK